MNYNEQELFRIVQNSNKVSEFRKYYWGYQFRLGAEVIVPYLQEHGFFAAGYNVAEIGCGEAGVLTALYNAGASLAVGSDIDEERIEIGKCINSELGIEYPLVTFDIINGTPPPEWREVFDLVILRDVIEHLDDAEKALYNIRALLKPNGKILITFPPYASPFGGHQHITRSAAGKLPYIHLLPRSMFLKLVGGGYPPNVEEVRRLSHIRFSPKKFKKAAKNAGYSIAYEDYYLLRPVFKMKFGLPTVKITPLKFIPGVQDFFSLEACYTLQKENL